MSGSTVKILFEGKELACRSGISVAAALWENGIKVLSRSPKYGRPRGVLCARGHCTNCLMRIDGVPNVRACQTEVRDGMTVARQDAGAFYGAPAQKMLNVGGGLMPVGFYYKWFTRPAALSKIFMQGIRPLTGVGRLPAEAAVAEDEAAIAAMREAGWTEKEPRDLGARRCVVIGGGAAGMAEALDAGRDVLLVDDMPTAGGQRLAALDAAARELGDGFRTLRPLAAARDLLTGLAAKVEAESGVEFAPATRVVGAYQPDMLLLASADGLSVVRSGDIRWAAGALDVLGIFPDNDLPGLMGPRGLYRLLAADGLRVAGSRAVVAGGGLDLWLSAALLHAAGATVTLALDSPDTEASLLEAAVGMGWRLHTGMKIVEARADGDALGRLVMGGENGRGARTEVPCEIAVAAGRAKPAYDVPYQLGADMVLDAGRGGYVPRGGAGGRWRAELDRGPSLTVAGEAAGADPRTVLVPQQEVR